jgi:hypothetical protein
MITSLAYAGVVKNVSLSVTMLTWFAIIIGFGFGLLNSLDEAFADTPSSTASVDPESHDFLPVPASKLSPGEHQQLTRIKKQFITPHNSKENPGDQNTWYVIGFMDSAQAETKAREATMLAGRTILWSDQKSNQQKIAKDAVIAHGRTAAAQAVLQYTNSPNAAATQLRSPSNTARDGWMKNQNTQVTTDRRWVYRAFAKESQARKFLESVRSTK